MVQETLERGPIRSDKSSSEVQFGVQYLGAICSFWYCLTFATHCPRIPKGFGRKYKKIGKSTFTAAWDLTCCGRSPRGQYQSCTANFRNGEVPVFLVLT